MAYYSLAYPSGGVSFVKTDEKQCIIIKRTENRVVMENNPFPFSHRPENSDLSMMSEDEFEEAFVKAIHELSIKTFIQ